MADLQVRLPLAFDRGIERVTYTRQGDTPDLPRREEGAPADVGGRPQMETLLALSTLDDALDASIRPELEHRDLMVPSRFREGLDGVLQQLRDAAAQLQEAGPGQDADRLRVLNRATRLLNEECQLRDLVQMYRSVLYQG